MTLLALLLLAASSRVVLVDDVFRVPPSEWRYVEVVMKQTPVTVRCDFEVVSRNNSKVRVALLTEDDLEHLREDTPHGFVAATPLGSNGRMRYRVLVPGHYAFVLDNRSADSAAASVHLRVALDFSPRSERQVRTLPPEKRLTVILLSFAVFLGIVFYSARKLLGAIKG